MAVERTLAMIKPDATARNLGGEILSRYEEEGFEIVGIKRLRLRRQEAQAFYAVHEERPFFDSLCEFMCSGPIFAVVLEREDAISHLRAVMGATNPEEAEEGTIRDLYGESIERNSVHGSDAPATATEEIAFFFARRELL